MGKSTRRVKTAGEFTVMDVSAKSSFGVRTRAKTLALKRLQNPSPSPDDSFSFLQLRSRRLEKFPPLIKPDVTCKVTVTSSSRPNPELNLNMGPGSLYESKAIELAPFTGGINFASATPRPALLNNDEPEMSYGENMVEVEEVITNVRETTPSSQVRNAKDIGTPGSSTRPSNSTTNSSWNLVQRNNIPTTVEMEDFFRAVEQSQLKSFTDKYNYDPVNDCPLPGRYEWVQLG